MTFAAMPMMTGFVPANDEEKFIFESLKGRGGRLRTTKPQIDKSDAKTGDAAYVWRWVAFQISAKPAHHCMPVMAEFDLVFDMADPLRHEKRRKRGDELTELANRIVNACVPLRNQHGIMRWGRALGMI